MRRYLIIPEYRPTHTKWLGAGGFIGAFDESDSFYQTQFVGGWSMG